MILPSFYLLYKLIIQDGNCDKVVTEEGADI